MCGKSLKIGLVAILLVALAPAGGLVAAADRLRRLVPAADRGAVLRAALVVVDIHVRAAVCRAAHACADILGDNDLAERRDHCAGENYREQFLH